MRLMADSLMAVERDCFVNVTIEKEGESTVDSVVLVSTAQSGSALGKLLPIPIPIFFAQIIIIIASRLQ